MADRGEALIRMGFDRADTPCQDPTRMPELPEVEWVVRSLNRVLAGRTIQSVTVHRPRGLHPTPAETLVTTLSGSRLDRVDRRGKYLVFHATPRRGKAGVRVLGHLGMTGRMAVAPTANPVPKHTVVSLDLKEVADRFEFVDPRGFGRFTLDLSPLDRLGPEPLDPGFTADALDQALRGSRQAIKTRLLDQTRLVGIGNIYASESLHRSRIHPARPAESLSAAELVRLHRAIQDTLLEAIEGQDPSNSATPVFYHGADGSSAALQPSRFRVYERAGAPCLKCGSEIVRTVQSSRSTYHCPACQPRRPSKNS